MSVPVSSIPSPISHSGQFLNDMILWLEIIITFYVHICFSALAIAEASKECYPDGESFTGSMLSLAHSNSSSSCSFPTGNV